MQRTGLSMVNGAIYAGFASHCDFYNYTGWIVGMSTSGNILTVYATMGGSGSQPQDGSWNGGGGGGGVWYLIFFFLSSSELSISLVEKYETCSRLFVLKRNMFLRRIHLGWEVLRFLQTDRIGSSSRLGMD